MKITGFDWSLQGRIIAALVNRLGGKVTLTDVDLGTPEGLLIDPMTPPGILTMEATSLDTRDPITPHNFDPADVKRCLL